MTSIPVSFNYKEKQYTGFLVQVTGNASAGGHSYHLYIQNYYRGSLHLAVDAPSGRPMDSTAIDYVWRFTSQRSHRLFVELLFVGPRILHASPQAPITVLFFFAQQW